MGLEAIWGIKTLNEIALEFGVHPVQVGQWKQEIQGHDRHPLRPTEARRALGYSAQNGGEYSAPGQGTASYLIKSSIACAMVRPTKRSALCHQQLSFKKIRLAPGTSVSRLSQTNHGYRPCGPHLPKHPPCGWVPADERWLSTFGRDVSLVSEDQYQALQPPSSLNNFPADLANKNLEYSGIYEDGWISEQAFFVLSPDSSSKFLTIAGSVPQIKDIDFSTVLRLSIDGKEIAAQKLGLGNFELSVPVTSIQGKQRIDTSFSKYQQLPGADGRTPRVRIVVALL